MGRLTHPRERVLRSLQRLKQAETAAAGCDRLPIGATSAWRVQSSQNDTRSPQWSEKCKPVEAPVAASRHGVTSGKVIATAGVSVCEAC
jgi:hypothetical protein